MQNTSLLIIRRGFISSYSGRKDMIKRDMAYSSDEAQIRAIFAAEIKANVKKGWEEL